MHCTLNLKTIHRNKYVHPRLARTIKRLFPDDERMLNFAKFLHIVDDMFDVLNASKEEHTSKPLKTCFEVNLELQTGVRSYVSSTFRRCTPILNWSE